MFSFDRQFAWSLKTFNLDVIAVPMSVIDSEAYLNCQSTLSLRASHPKLEFHLNFKVETDSNATFPRMQI